MDPCKVKMGYVWQVSKRHYEQQQIVLQWKKTLKKTNDTHDDPLEITSSFIIKTIYFPLKVITLRLREVPGFRKILIFSDGPV